MQYSQNMWIDNDVYPVNKQIYLNSAVAIRCNYRGSQAEREAEVGEGTNIQIS